MSRFVRLGAFAVFAAFASACSVNLQHDLTEDDANDIYVLLQKKSIDANKVKEGEGKDARFVISVPKADVATAAQLLREHSLPRPRSDGLAIFKMTKGMIPTQTEERAMFIEALGGEVSNALNRIPGVLESKTIVMMPEVNDLTQPDKKPLPTASVLVKYMAVDGKPPVGVEDVSAFVANAVPELKKENVKVIMTEAKFVTEVSEEPRLQRFMGVNVDKASAGTFKAIIGVFALLFIAMAGITAFMVVRKPSAPKPPPRAKTPPEG
ncbi:MAG: type III secretion protein [Myxococcaceae bacterium]